MVATDQRPAERAYGATTAHEGEVADRRLGERAGSSAVREAFVENFTRRGELGAACCIYQDGEKVVDLWGGVRDRIERRAVARRHHGPRPLDDQGPRGDGHGAGALARLARLRRACLHLLARVRAGRQGAASRSASCSRIKPGCSRSTRRSIGRSSPISIASRRSWPGSGRRGSRASGRPITRSVSASTKASSCVGSILAHRSLGRFFDEEIAQPLGLEFYIGVPESIPDARLAPLEPPSLWKRLTGMPLALTLAAMNRRSVLYRSLIANPGTGFYVDPRHVVVRNLEVPSGGGVGTARAIAKAYGVFASGGRELGLRPETIEALRRRRSRRAMASSTSASAGRRSSRSGS